MSASIITTPPDLPTASLQIDIAIAILPLIDDMVTDPADRRLVIADIAHRWQHLPPEQQARYDGNPQEPGPIAFAIDYTTAIDRRWREHTNTDPFTLHHFETDRLCRHGWQQHLHHLRSQTEPQPRG